MATGLAASKGAARRTVAEGGAYLNNVRVEDPAAVPDAADPARRAVPRAAPGPQGLRGRGVPRLSGAPVDRRRDPLTCGYATTATPI